MTHNEIAQSNETPAADEKKSLLGVIVHSFFIVPFLIAVFSILLFASIRMLTMEGRSVYDYIEDVKTGGLTKRWQAAFELSKILANPKLIPQEARFNNELISAFKHSQHDDSRVRQYLALAMGRTGKEEFVGPLLENIEAEKEEDLYTIIYALGLLKAEKSIDALLKFVDHENSRIRLVSIVALGNITNPTVIPALKKALNDSEPNVQWDAAIALAKKGDISGKEVLLKLLDRSYLSQFPEVDIEEQMHILLVSIEAASKLNDSELNSAIQNLGSTDQNMNVKKATQAVIK